MARTPACGALTDPAERTEHRDIVFQYDGGMNAQATAHRLVREAIERGELIRPENCVSCGVIGLVHAHHADYDLPLAVNWLCVSCHVVAHNRLRMLLDPVTENRRRTAIRKKGARSRRAMDIARGVL